MRNQGRPRKSLGKLKARQRLWEKGPNAKTQRMTEVVEILEFAERVSRRAEVPAIVIYRPLTLFEKPAIVIR